MKLRLPSLFRPAPTNLVATTVSAKQINLTWKPTTSLINDYSIERKTGTGSFVQIGGTGSSTLSYSDTGLSPGTTYTYRVRDDKIGIFSAYSNVASATTSPYVVVAAPTNLTATSDLTDRITLSWKAGTSAVAGFAIEGKFGSGPYSQIATVGATVRTFSSDGNGSNNTYTFRVRAYNTGNYSGYSNEAKVTTPPPQPPAPPANLFAVTASMSQINLSWTGTLVSATSYALERKSGTANFAQIATVAGTTWSYSDKGLAAGTTYSYRVRALVSGVYTGYSNVTSVTTIPLPTPPTGLKATVLSASQIKLSWTIAGQGAGGYCIERKTGSGSYTQIATALPTDESYTNTGLTAGTYYTYRVRGYTSGIYSAYSNEATATTTKAASVKKQAEINTPLRPVFATLVLSVIDSRGCCVARTNITSLTPVSEAAKSLGLASGFYIARVHGEYATMQWRMIVGNRQVQILGEQIANK